MRYGVCTKSKVDKKFLTRIKPFKNSKAPLVSNKHPKNATPASTRLGLSNRPIPAISKPQTRNKDQKYETSYSSICPSTYSGPKSIVTPQCPERLYPVFQLRRSVCSHARSMKSFARSIYEGNIFAISSSVTTISWTGSRLFSSLPKS